MHHSLSLLSIFSPFPSIARFLSSSASSDQFERVSGMYFADLGLLFDPVIEHRDSLVNGQRSSSRNP
jgi:hypothetical protein